MDDLKLNKSSVFEDTTEASFEQELNRMFAVPSNGHLHPDPEIQKHLLALLERKRAKRKSLLQKAVQFLEVRIPVYQAAFAMAILVSAVLISDRWMTEPTTLGPPGIEKLISSQPTRQTPQTFPSMSIVDSLAQYRDSVSDTFFTTGVIDSL